MNTNQVTTPPVDELEYRKWLDEIIRLHEGAPLRGTSVHTFKRQAKADGALLDVSRRCKGVRRGYALMKPGYVKKSRGSR